MDGFNKTLDGKTPQLCSDYEKGKCKNSGKMCDLCYEHISRDINNNIY